MRQPCHGCAKNRKVKPVVIREMDRLSGELLSTRKMLICRPCHQAVKEAARR